MPAGIWDTIVEWESNGLPKERIKPPITANIILSPKLRWMNNLNRLFKTRQSSFYYFKCSKFTCCL